MRVRRRRFFQLPVLSRLTLAWVCALSIVIVIGGALSLAVVSGRGGARVSLPVSQLEIMARAPARGARTEERLAAPAQNDAGAVAQEILSHPAELDFAENEDESFSENDVVITIAGGDAPALEVNEASVRGEGARAIAAPDPALMKTTSFGKAPQAGPDGRKAMQVYAQRHDNPQGRPEIAIILGGLGLNAALTERAIDELPPQVSLAFAPYAKDLEFWTEKARKAGHEVLIELPMEGYGASAKALGPAALLSARSASENLQRLDWLMARFPGYFAATNYMGAKFSADKNAIVPVLERLGEAGVAYVDDTGAARAAAAQSGALVATVNRVIPAAPDESGRGAVRRELRAIERIAERNGAALAKTYAFAVTIEELAAWMEDFQGKGFVAAPASAVLPMGAVSR